MIIYLLQRIKEIAPLFYFILSVTLQSVKEELYIGVTSFFLYFLVNIHCKNLKNITIKFPEIIAQLAPGFGVNEKLSFVKNKFYAKSKKYGSHF